MPDSEPGLEVYLNSRDTHMLEGLICSLNPARKPKAVSRKPKTKDLQLHLDLNLGGIQVTGTSDHRHRR